MQKKTFHAGIKLGKAKFLMFWYHNIEHKEGVIHDKNKVLTRLLYSVSQTNSKFHQKKMRLSKLMSR